MYIRTTTLDTNRSMLNYISTQESKYNKLSETAASGVRVANPSDDPTATRSILNLNSKLNQMQSYLDNMSMSTQEIKTLDDTLTSAADLIQKANDLAIQAANGTYSNSDLDGFKTQIDSITESLVSLSNTEYNGTYLFSGTSVGTRSYTLTKDGTGTITGLTYNGTPSTGDYERKVTISDGVTATVNTTGDAVFGEYDSTTTPVTATGMFGSLMQLSAALGAHDQAAVSSSLSGLSTAADNITAVQTKFATTLNKFEMTTDSTKATMLDLKEYRSDLKDADLAEVLSDLATAETALNATYSVTSKLLGSNSLLDYM